MVRFLIFNSVTLEVSTRVNRVTLNFETVFECTVVRVWVQTQSTDYKVSLTCGVVWSEFKCSTMLWIFNFNNLLLKNCHFKFLYFHNIYSWDSLLFNLLNGDENMEYFCRKIKKTCWFCQMRVNLQWIQQPGCW